jgi:hypothetical protein
MGDWDMGTGKQGGRALYTFDLVLILSGILEMGCKAKGADCFLDLDQRVGLRDWDNWEIFFFVSSIFRTWDSAGDSSLDLTLRFAG